MKLEVGFEKNKIEIDEVTELYKANGWSAAEKPELLILALRNSDSIVTARISGKLVGIGNALSDGYLVVYYPHMLVHPEHHRKGIGRAMMQCFLKKYASFHQQILVADGKAIDFYKNFGFEKAGEAEAMWIYRGHEH
jgi:predicted N-acetyltransferase YhbS